MWVYVMFTNAQNELSRSYSLDLILCVENLGIFGHLGIGLSLRDVANKAHDLALIPFSAVPLLENFKFNFLIFFPSLMSFLLRPNPYIAYPIPLPCLLLLCVFQCI